MKKLFSLLLAAVMLLGAVSFASAEEEKPTVLLWGFSFDYLYDVNGNLKDPADSGVVQQAAVEEWAANNGVTIDYRKGDANALAATIAGGEIPALIFTSNAFPSLADLGLLQPIPTDWLAEFTAEFGTSTTDPLKYKGEVYGVMRIASSIGAIQYNRTRCEDMGIKTPKEYFLEGNWTYETYAQFLKDCTQDIDGDGKLDTIGAFGNPFTQRVVPLYAMNENGLVSLASSERVRDFFGLMHDAYLYGAISEQNPGNSGGLAGTPYFMTRFYQVNTAKLSRIWSVSNGEVIESVPVPVWKKGDTEQSQSLNFVYYFLPKACKDTSIGLSLIKDLLLADMEYYDAMSEGKAGYGVKAIDGTLPWTAEYLKLRAEKVAKDNAATYALAEYDPDYLETLYNYYKTANFHILLNVADVGNIKVDGSADWRVLYEMPTATALAQIVPVLEAQIEAYNSKVAD